jgi:hypothetical protein
MLAGMMAKYQETLEWVSAFKGLEYWNGVLEWRRAGEEC